MYIYTDDILLLAAICCIIITQVMNLKKKTVFLTLAVLHMALIFAFSAQNAEQSSGTSMGFIRLFLDMFSNIGSDAALDAIASGAEFFVRKAAHFSLYLLLGIYVTGFVTQFGLNTRKTAAAVILWCFLYAVSDEAHQYFVPGRACRLYDMLIDTCGAAAGLLLFRRFFKLCNNKKRGEKRKKIA